ncbi:hypothetical protein RZS08_38910, partial [Arthrospira platensis SPKY1]|nr:hypothetical protein [Arthrospira platensis SPKY1]
MNQNAIADDWAQALEEQARVEQADGAPAFDSNDTPAEARPPGGNSMQDIQMVLDIPIQLSVELGRTKVPIK